MLTIFMLLLYFSSQIYGNLTENLVVETEVGSIRGLQGDDGDYAMFLGIPYGKVDENNPFGVSTPYPVFEETFNAFDDSIMCPHIEEFNNTLVGTPDCLTLNIFVPPSATANNRLPVLVNIHGGGFSIGFGNRFLYRPNFLIRYDVILVSINYRLGPYGFMCLESPNVPGNQGLKDQVLALRWIKQNIEAFYGDSNKITVFGNSAGAMSIDYHLVSKNEKLFEQAILQSSALAAPSYGNYDAPITLAEYLGLSTNNVDEAVRYISTLNSDVVIDATNALGLSFSACVEKAFDGVESFITYDWIKEPLHKIANMPIIIGFNDDEMLLSAMSDNDEDYAGINPVPGVLRGTFNANDPDFDGMEDIVYHFYFGDDELSASNRQKLIDIRSDTTFVYPAYRIINKYLRYGVGNIFLYYFTYVGQRNFVREKGNVPVDFGGGAAHADELGFLFDISYMKDFDLSAEEQRVVDRITTLFTNFAKYGNPTPQTSELLPVSWTPITAADIEKRPHLEIGADLILGNRPIRERAAFWDLFFSANDHLLRGVTISSSSSFAIRSCPLITITLSLLLSLLAVVTCK